MYYVTRLSHSTTYMKGQNMEKYSIVLSVDNNRYGAYYKCFAKREFTVEAANKETAYQMAAQMLQSERRYKNTVIRSFDNRGSHDWSSWSINLHSLQRVS